MTGNIQSGQNLENQYPNKIENPEYRQKLEKWYQKQEKIRLLIILGCLFFLFLSGIGQLFLLDSSFKERFGLDDSDAINFFLSLLVTAALPITTILDESGILDEKIKISLGTIRFSPIIWVILPGDMLLTLQAVLVANQNAKKPDPFLPAIAFVLAAVFSISALYLSKGIVAAARKYMLARKNLQIIRTYGVNPVPLYEDAEQIKLIEETEAAKTEAEQAREKLAEEIAQHEQQLSVQQQQFQEQIKSHEEQQLKQLQERDSELEKYKEKLDEVKQLKTKFDELKTPIIGLLNQVKGFAGIDESIKDFKFPKLEINQPVNGKTIEIPTYYWSWHNSDSSREYLPLQSELSVVGYSLLNAMQQHKKLPRPNVRDYAPKPNLSKCLVLRFQNYGLIVYCRDEEYRQDGEKWDIEAQFLFQSELTEQRKNGYCALEFTAQQIMNNPLAVLTQIEDVINAKNTENESN